MKYSGLLLNPFTRKMHNARNQHQNVWVTVIFQDLFSSVNVLTRCRQIDCDIFSLNSSRLHEFKRFSNMQSIFQTGATKHQFFKNWEFSSDLAYLFLKCYAQNCLKSCRQQFTENTTNNMHITYCLYSRLKGLKELKDWSRILKKSQQLTFRHIMAPKTGNNEGF